jgi:carboxypeptidase C (cathepsin A)
MPRRAASSLAMCCCVAAVAAASAALLQQQTAAASAIGAAQIATAVASPHSSHPQQQQPPPWKPPASSSSAAAASASSAAATTAAPDLVTSLPTLVGGLLETNYAGLIQVSAAGHLFYWFSEARAPLAQPAALAQTPVVVWLNGGPGSSSLTGLLTENGPYAIVAGNSSLVPNALSWNARYHTLYVDQPVGTGFSYCEGNETSCYCRNQTQVSAQLVALLEAFFTAHPEYSACPLYITGESYAGKYISYVGAFIVQNAGAHQMVRGAAQRGAARRGVM